MLINYFSLFFSVSGQTGRKVYLFGEDIKNHITDLVLDQLASEDPSIADVFDGHVYGESVGSTVVKVRGLLYKGN